MVSFMILLVLVIVFALWAVGQYNGLVAARNAFRNAFAQIDVQLQRRFELIPNLVETVKGYAKHEEATLTAVIEARAKATSIQVDASTLDNPEKLKQFQQQYGPDL